MSKKISIQLVQLNNRYGNQVYMPYSVGVLETFVKQKEIIRENYHFKEFIFLREDISNMVKKSWPSGYTKEDLLLHLELENES